MNRVAAGAQPVIFDLQIEAAVEIESQAVLLKTGTYPGPVGEDEIDTFRSREKRTLDCCDGHALRAFLLNPLELRNERARLDRDAQDDLVLDNETRHRLADDA